MNNQAQLYSSKTVLHHKLLQVAEASSIVSATSTSDGLHSVALTQDEYSDIFETTSQYADYKHVLLYRYSDLDPETTAVKKSYVVHLRLGALMKMFNLLIPTRENGTALFLLDTTRGIHKYRTIQDHMSADPTVAVVPNINWECGVDDGIKKSRFITDIFVSVDFVLSTLDTLVGTGASVDMFTFMDTLLQGIQNNLGNINAFELQYYEEEAQFAVVDRENLQTSTAPFPKINILNTSSIVKNVQLVSKLSPAITSALSISAQSDAYTGTEEGIGFSHLNKGLIDRLFPEKAQNSLHKYKTNVKAESDKIKYTRGKLQKDLRQLITVIYKPDSATNRLQFSMEDTPAVQTILRNYYKLLIGIENNPSLTRIIPFELQLTLEGISGMRVMEAFVINEDILPYPYRTKFDDTTKIAFLITGLEHEITINGWETKVKAQIFLEDKSKAETPQISIVDPDFAPSPKSDEGSGNTETSGKCKTAYPDLPFTDPRPGTDQLSYTKAIQYLKSKYDSSLAKAVFAILFAEASKNDGKFNSAGGHNYAGVQTDNAKWGAPGIIGQYCRVDSGGKSRAFAIFESDETFLDFMANRVSAKGFNGNSGDSWVVTYINSWWSPKNKATYSKKGSEKYNAKLAIYNTAIKTFNDVA